MQEFNQNEMPNVAVFANTLENYYQISDDDFAAISEYRYNNDYQFSGEGTIIPFENASELTDNNFSDKAYIKYFSDLRNQVVEAFYNDKEENKGLIYINVIGDEIIRCLKFNGSISYNYNGSMVSIAYDTLSDEAKKVVLNIASDCYRAMYDYDTFSYEGNDYNMNDIHEIIVELSNKLESSKTK